MSFAKLQFENFSVIPKEKRLALKTAIQKNFPNYHGIVGIREVAGSTTTYELMIGEQPFTFQSVNTIGYAQQAQQTLPELTRMNSQAPWIAEILSNYQQLSTLMQLQVISHASLSDNPLLFDGKTFWQITFSNDLMTDHFYQLATLVNNFKLSPQQERILLKNFFNKPASFKTLQFFFLLKQLALIHQVMLATINFKERSHIDFLLEKIRLVRKTGRYQAALENILSINKPEPYWHRLPLSLQHRVLSFLPAKVFGQHAPNKAWARLALTTPQQSQLLIEAELKKKVPEKDIAAMAAAIMKTCIPFCTELASQTYLSPHVSFSIEAFTDGMSPWANTYKVIVNDDFFVLRRMSLEQPQKNRQREISVMAIFSHFGLSPKVHFSSAKIGIIIMEFVENITNWYEKMDNETLMHLGFIFTQLEQVQLSQKTKATFFKNPRLQVIHNRVHQHCFTTENPQYHMFRDALREIDRIKPLCEQFTTLTICHHDLHMWNILQALNKSFQLIDFEFSQAGDLLFDLGSLVVFLRLNEETEAALLTSYFGQTPNQYELSLFLLFKQYAILNFIVMVLGICKNFPSVAQTEIDELPAFNDYNPETTVLSKPSEPRSDVRHFKMAVMFDRQARRYAERSQYKEGIKYLSNYSLRSRERPDPRFREDWRLS